MAFFFFTFLQHITTFTIIIISAVCTILRYNQPHCTCINSTLVSSSSLMRDRRYKWAMIRRGGWGDSHTLQSCYQPSKEARGFWQISLFFQSSSSPLNIPITARPLISHRISTMLFFSNFISFKLIRLWDFFFAESLHLQLSFPYSRPCASSH